LLCVWINVDASADYSPPPFDPVASFFGIWHEHKRGAHKGLHEFHFNTNYVLLLNVYARVGDTYKAHMPADATVIENSDFRKDVRSFANEKINNAKRVKLNVKSYGSASSGLSCDDVCTNIGNANTNSNVNTNTNTTTRIEMQR